MTQTIVTTQATEQLSVCANCPFFKDYGGYGGRGLCHLSETVTRRHWKKVSDCDRAIEALKEECQLKESDTAYAVMAELATREEEEQDGYPVPVDALTLPVTVSRLERTAVIAAAIAKGYGEGYALMDWWQPGQGDGEEEF